MADSPTESATFHAKARWIGIPLFWAGALGTCGSLVLWLAGQVPGACVMLYIASTGLSLATFGTHNDTAVSWMVRAGETALAPERRAELREELAVDRQGVSALSPTPKTAWVMTLIAILLHVWAAWRFVGALA